MQMVLSLEQFAALEWTILRTQDYTDFKVLWACDAAGASAVCIQGTLTGLTFVLPNSACGAP